MTDIFEVVASKSNRIVLEAMAALPGATQAEIAKKTKLSAELVAKSLEELVGSKLAKKTGTLPNAKYTLSPAGFTPFMAWLGKVAEAQTVAAVEKQLTEFGSKVGTILADGANWVGKSVSDQIQIDVDPKRLGREIGRKLADAKADVQKEADNVVKQVKARVKR